MNTTSSYTGEGTSAYEPTTVAATFADRESAHDAVHRLHDEGFRDTWIGIARADSGDAYGQTAAGETRVESENWFSRFFGEGDESLHDALVRHGVAESDAMSAAGIAPNAAILTVDGANHPELAAEILAQFGGTVITRGFGATGYQRPMNAATMGGAWDDTTAGMPAERGTLGDPIPDSATLRSGRRDVYDVETDMAQPAGASLGTVTNATDDRYATDVPLGGIEAGDISTLPADRSGYDTTGFNDYRDYGNYRGGESIDGDRRLQLREERLQIDKQRLSRGEVTIGKDVVSRNEEIDVPIVREELFVERRPVTGQAAETAAAPIGSESEIIRVPLTEEQVIVTKVPVVTEEIVVGKRQVQSTEHVSETTRKEQLNVADMDAADTRVGATGSSRF